MKGLVISCLLFSILISVCNGTPDCKRFRNGSFIILSKKAITNIKREGNRQLEWQTGKTIPDTFRVQWLNDCSYRLFPSKSYIEEYHVPRPDASITVDILTTSLSSCHIHVSANFTNKTMEAEMVNGKL